MMVPLHGRGKLSCSVWTVGLGMRGGKDGPADQRLTDSVKYVVSAVSALSQSNLSQNLVSRKATQCPPPPHSTTP